MESTPVNSKVVTEGSSQVNNAALALEKEGCPDDNLPPGGSLGQDLGFKEMDNEIDGSIGIAESLKKPSLLGTIEPPMSDEMIELLVEAPITNQYVPGRSVVIIRPRDTSSQVNPQGHGNLVLEEGDEEIVEEEAVRKFCFDVFIEENTLKTVCRCKNALIHEECGAKWLREKGNDNCDFCGEKVENFPVTLLRGLSSTRRVDAK